MGTLLWARERLLEALETVPGIEPMPSAPDAPVDGQAWPKWVSTNMQGGKLTRPLMHTFDVLAMLPAGYGGETVAAADELLPVLIGAIARIASFDEGDPVQVIYPPSAGAPAIRIRCTPRPERLPTHA